MRKILSILCGMLMATSAFADIIWTNAASGYWTNGANWSTGQYPGQAGTNAAVITNGVATVILDVTTPYFVPGITVSNLTGTTELRVTNSIETGTAYYYLGNNTRIYVTPGSKWATPPIQGNKFFSGTNVVMDIETNGTWEIYDAYWGANTIGGNYSVLGGGTIDFQSGILLVGYSNTAGYASLPGSSVSAGNTLIISDTALRNAYIHEGVNSKGNTLILSNSYVTCPPVSVSYRAGASGANGACASNTLILTGPRAFIDTQGSYCYIPNGTFGLGCVFQVDNGAALSNSLVVNYNVSIPNTTDCSSNSFLITNGGQGYEGTWSVGTQARSHSNLLAVTGSGSKIDVTGNWPMTIGATTTTGNVLRIADGGDVRGISVLTIYTNNILDFTKGRLSTHDFNYYPTSRYVLGSNCTFAVEPNTAPTYDGVWYFNGGLLIDSNATLRGRGIVGGGSGIILTNGGSIIGSMEGTLTLTNLTWAGGGKYTDKIGFMGSRGGSGRSLMYVGTNLTFVDPSQNYTIALDSDGATISDFVPTENYVLKIVDAGVLTGYDPTKFTLNTNAFLLNTAPTAPWVLTNFAGKIFVTYSGTPEDDTANGQTWAVTSNGNWSVASNWTNNVAPTSGVGVILEFGGTGTNRYYATNDVANPFDVYKLLITSGSTSTNVITGNPLRFNGADGGIFKNNGGATIISNSLSFSSNATFWGTEALEGSVTLATNFNVTGNLRKTGKWTLILQGSNYISGDLILDSRGGGGIQFDANARMIQQNAYVSNGVLNRTSTSPFTFAGGATPATYLLTGPGSLYQAVAAFTVGTNIIFTVTNSAQIRSSSSITVNGSGSVPNPFDICGGQAYVLADSFIGNSNNNNRVSIHCDGIWDLGSKTLYVGSGTGTNNVLTLDDGGTVDNALSVYVGGVSGVAGNNYNGIVVTNGGLLRMRLGLSTAGPFRIGNGIGASYNYLDIRKGGKVTTIGGTLGSRSYIGFGQNAVGNWVRVDGGILSMIGDSNSSGMRIGYGNGVTSRSVANHLDIVNGGFFQDVRPGAQANSYVDIGASSGACSNYVYVAGTGTLWEVAGQAIPIGFYTGNTGNYLRVENGAVVNNANALYVGSSASVDAYANYISVSNATLYSGAQGSSSYVGGSFRGQRNYIEILGANSLWHNPASLFIGGGADATASNNVDNYVLVDAATVLHLNNLRLGVGANDARNYLSLTNGASFNSDLGGTVYIGYNATSRSNWISIVNSTWDVGSGSITVGTNSSSIGNQLIVNNGVMTRLETLTISSNNTMTMNGGLVDAKNLVVSGTLAGTGAIGVSHATGSDVATFNAGAILQPTAPFTLADIVLPATMTINASNLVGTILISYSGSASGSTDLSGWTIVGGPAGYTARLDTTAKQVKLMPPTASLRVPHNRALFKDGKLQLKR